MFQKKKNVIKNYVKLYTSKQYISKKPHRHCFVLIVSRFGIIGHRQNGTVYTDLHHMKRDFVEN